MAKKKTKKKAARKKPAAKQRSSRTSASGMSKKSAKKASTTKKAAQVRMKHNKSEAARKQKERALKRDLFIPPPANIERRNAALADSVTFMKTYKGDPADDRALFIYDFTENQVEIVNAVDMSCEASTNQAISGPRGVGKTQLSKSTIQRNMMAGVTQACLFINKTQKDAAEELLTLKNEFRFNPLLAEDFPELCIPFQALAGSGHAAAAQTVLGEFTRIAWKNDYIKFPVISDRTLRKMGWPKAAKSCARGQYFASIGIEGSIRGFNIDGKRPDLVLVDDVEDQAAAESEVEIEKRKTIIKRDIMGLRQPGAKFSVLVLCTLQNNMCFASWVTDREQFPMMNGLRLRLMKSWPVHMDMWEEYWTKLYEDARRGDMFGRGALAYYMDNLEAMQEGADVDNDWFFNGEIMSDGKPRQVDSLQACMDMIAESDIDSFNTEYNSLPPKEEDEGEDELTIHAICKQVNGLAEYQAPPKTTWSGLFIDTGRKLHHYLAAATTSYGATAIMHYGTKPVINIGSKKDSIRLALEGIVEEVEEAPYHIMDELGEIRPLTIDQVWIDNGDGMFSDVINDLVLDLEGGSPKGKRYRVAMGLAKYHAVQTVEKNRKPGFQAWESRINNGGRWIWQVNQNPNYWKYQAHEGFKVFDTKGGIHMVRDENGLLLPGSITLFGSDGRKHRDDGTGNFAKQILGEKPDPKTLDLPYPKYIRLIRNQHFLDCLAGYLCQMGQNHYQKKLKRNKGADKQRTLAEWMGFATKPNLGQWTNKEGAA